MGTLLNLCYMIVYIDLHGYIVKVITPLCGDNASQASVLELDLKIQQLRNYYDIPTVNTFK